MVQTGFVAELLYAHVELNYDQGTRLVFKESWNQQYKVANYVQSGCKRDSIIIPYSLEITPPPLFLLVSFSYKYGGGL